MRSHPSKTDCIIIDIANNTLRHGLVRDYKKEDYFLEYEPPKKGGKAPIRKCKECGHIQHPSIKACQECGYVFPIKVKNPYLIDLSDLDDIDKQYRKNIKFAYKKKYSPAYAFYKYMTASDGQKPTLDLALPQPSSSHSTTQALPSCPVSCRCLAVSLPNEKK